MIAPTMQAARQRSNAPGPAPEASPMHDDPIRGVTR